MYCGGRRRCRGRSFDCKRPRFLPSVKRMKHDNMLKDMWIWYGKHFVTAIFGWFWVTRCGGRRRCRGKSFDFKTPRFHLSIQRMEYGNTINDLNELSIVVSIRLMSYHTHFVSGENFEWCCRRSSEMSREIVWLNEASLSSIYEVNETRKRSERRPLWV